MPAKNVIKIFTENGYYHVYNRGVDKRIIFLDITDCSVFLHYMRLYLSPLDQIQKEVQNKSIKLRFTNLNLSQEVSLISFALMPNHFHLLLKQNSIDGITKFMKRLSTAYVMYFNNRYKRVGPLFQGIYKACSVQEDPYLVHLTRYIHLNPQKISSTIDFNKFTSYQYYLKKKHALWIHPEDILIHFNEKRKGFSYEDFVENPWIGSKEILGNLVLEDD